MNRTALVATAAAVLLLLAGCTAGSQPEPADSISPTVVSPPAQVAAPLVAETPSAPPSDVSTPEAAFLAQVREVLPTDTVIPNATDEQLLVAGRAACEQMAAGTDPSAVAVIEGEPVNGLEIHEDSAAIAILATKTICP